MRSIVACAVICLCASTVMGDNWPRFRGPNGRGIAQDSDIPAKWSEEDLAWKIKLPGTGHSSPVVWEETVYVTCADEEAKVFSLLALRASDGRLVWKRDYSFEPLRINPLNSHATSTPAVDAEGVYALWFGENQSFAVAVSHVGTELWKKDLGHSSTLHGPSLSPMVYKGMLVFTLEHEKNDVGLQSHWYALDCSTGEIAWRLDRENSAKASSSVPCVYRSQSGKESLVFSSRAHGITAVDPANGIVVWEEKSALPTRVVSSPVLAKDFIVATCGDGGRGIQLTAVHPTGERPPRSRVVYTIEEAFVPYVPTPIAVNDLLFLYEDRGMVSCIEIETGKLRWSERPGGKFLGSPVLVEDRLYCINTSGKVVVLRAAAKYELLAVNDLGEASQASPAVAGARMFLRTNSHLSCIAATKRQ